MSIRPSVVNARETPSAEVDETLGGILFPGVEEIGCGYNVFGGFADVDSVTEPLFDLGEPTEFSTKDGTYYKPVLGRGPVEKRHGILDILPALNSSCRIKSSVEEKRLFRQLSWECSGTKIHESGSKTEGPPPGGGPECCHSARAF
jgi:hypothetical protein